jgi:hypothetical protein
MHQCMDETIREGPKLTNWEVSQYLFRLPVVCYSLAIPFLTAATGSLPNVGVSVRRRTQCVLRLEVNQRLPIY